MNLAANSSSPTAFHPLQTQLDWNFLLKQVLVNGGEWADVFWERKLSNHIQFKDGVLHHLSDAHDEGIGIRVLLNGRAIFGHTNVLSEEGVKDLITRVARSASNFLRGDAIAIVSSPSSDGAISQLQIAESITREPLARKIKLLEDINLASQNNALNVKRITSRLLDVQRQTFVVRSDEKQFFDEQSQVVVGSELIGQAPDGKLHETFHRLGGFWDWAKLMLADPNILARENHRHLAFLYRSKAAPSGSMPVILSGQAGGVMCHEAVGHGLEADYACENLSAYSGKMGEQVASTLISVIDEGNIAFARGSQSRDDEGNPTRKNILIENGKLVSYMHDQKTALKTGSTPTGNGRRESYKHLPQCRMTNTYIAAGSENAANIIRDTPWGLFVTKMGGGQVDSLSGDFVFEVEEAYIIRNGEISEAVRGATLTGNGPSVLKEIDRVGNDLGFDIGTCGKTGQWVPVTDGQPTMRIPKLTVGGTASLSDYFSTRS